MVRTVHTNHFYEILAQISDPKIEFLTKTHFLKNDHVQKNQQTCYQSFFTYNLVRVGSVEPSLQGLFLPKTTFPKTLDMAIFQKSEFSRKTPFLGHLFGEISHKSCSYGLYGPFRFSMKHGVYT